MVVTELAQVTDRVDALLIVPLCALCAQRIGERDTTPKRQWEGEEAPYRII